MRGSVIKYQSDSSLGRGCYYTIKMFNSFKEEVGIHEYTWGNSSCAALDATIIHHFPV